MAAFDLTKIEPVNLDRAETYEVDFVTGHSVGDVIEVDGTISSSVSDLILGVCVRAGSAGTNGNKTLVMRRGEVRSSDGTSFGVAANKAVYVDANNAATDTEPAGAAGTRITELGYTYSTTRAFLDVTTYEKGA